VPILQLNMVLKLFSNSYLTGLIENAARSEIA
jgi:hypothetical protein